MNLRNLLGIQTVLEPPASGIYHFKEKSEQGEARMHLRIETDGSGVLLVNASRVYHFNPTAAFMTYLVLKEQPEKAALKAITSKYNVPKKKVVNDYRQIFQQIKLITTPNYEKIAKLIRTMVALDENEIAILKGLSSQTNNNELIQITQFLSPGDEEELTSLLPVIYNLDPISYELISSSVAFHGSTNLVYLLKELSKIPSGDMEKLTALSEADPFEEIIEPIFDTILPFSKTDLTAPYRMDLALTYQCNNRCHHCYNPAHRLRAELDTETWKKVIDQLWEIGIPHIIFTGGEPTLRPDLPELIAHAEQNGQITGINTNGRMLKDKNFVQNLVDAGLDHIQITLESHDPTIHDHMVNKRGAWQETIDGIKNAIQTRLYVMTNTTLLTNNYQELKDTLEFLNKIGVKRVGLNALIYSGQGKEVGTGLQEADLPDLLVLARDLSEKNQQKLTWYTPTQYCHFDPVLFDHENIGVKGCTAALYNMCIEPDGKVLPCQSYYQPIGNILENSWTEIWNHDLAQQLRSRDHVPQECKECSLLSICGGGCPLAYQAGKIAEPKTIHFVDA